MTRIQREDRSVRIVSGARGVGEVGGMKTSAPGFVGSSFGDCAFSHSGPFSKQTVSLAVVQI